MNGEPSKKDVRYAAPDASIPVGSGNGTGVKPARRILAALDDGEVKKSGKK